MEDFSHAVSDKVSDTSSTANGPVGLGAPKQHRRTRTGCLTCRKRRKKCDEGQPKCKNCVHLGKTCEYQNTTDPKLQNRNRSKYKPVRPAPLISKSAPRTYIQLPPITTGHVTDDIHDKRHESINERLKMLQGKDYYSGSEILMADRAQCSAAIRDLNNSGPHFHERLKYLTNVVRLRPVGAEPSHVVNGSIGVDVIIATPFYCIYGYNLTIGSNVKIGPNCRFEDSHKVVIGNNVIIHEGTNMYSSQDPDEPSLRSRGILRARSIVVNDDVLVGSKVLILPGVTIGKGSRIAPGSVVHDDVPPYKCVRGNPAQIVYSLTPL